MGFVSICTAAYDYQPQSDGELELTEGDVLYILEKSDDDDWWKAKKKAVDDEDDEPEGLVPNNYVEEASPVSQARALYDYTRQTDEEVSFTEDAMLEIYDTSDPDWTLVHVNGEYGFAPANYIEILDAAPTSSSVATPRPRAAAIPPAPEPEYEPSPPASPVRESQSPAANLARVLGGRAPTSPMAAQAVASPPRQQREPTPEPSDEEPAPALPQRPRSQTIPAAPRAVTPDPEPPGVVSSPPYKRTSVRYEADDGPLRSPGGYHLYNVSEMVSAMGKRKKLPITLGLNTATGTIMLSPEKSRDGPTQEWTADKMQHYSIEGKHVFMELVRPSKSLDLHAGAKDTAQEIVASLGEIAGAHRAEGLKEVITAAAGGQKKGVMLYDFMAQGDDEVTVGEGDEVIVLDDTKSEEWWNVRRVKNGKEGVVPSTYIEVTGTVEAEPPSRMGINAGRSTVEQNRLEEERLAKEAAKANRAQRQAEEARAREIELPERGSSLDPDTRRSSRRDKRSSRAEGKSRSKPDPGKTRTWTDHSGSFKVDAQFIGVADGKIHLHKVNGVKIAVPVAKMSQVDLEYIEKVMRDSIEDHIPVANLLKMKRTQDGRSGASIEPATSQRPKVPDYDWFDFFLAAGVGVHQCERYSQAMVRDSMDESVLPDITMETLRTLGLKEGDALKVMKYLDTKYTRNRVNGDGQTGGLFAGPGGALKNNRQRPEADRKASDKVDPNAFQPSDSTTPTDAAATPLTQAPAREPRDGFEDDAWSVKPPTQQPAAKPAAATPSPTVPRPSDNLAALSLLDKPLEPTPAAPPRPASQPQAAPPAQQSSPAPAPAPPQPQQTGATPQFFQQVGQQQSGSQMPPQATGYQLNVPRQRPQPPQQSYTGSALLPPPPRPTSAPQNAQQNQYMAQPLQPQLTGLPGNAHPAPPGQSLDDITAQRIQQYAQMRPQPTGFPQQGYGMPNGMQPQPTGFQPMQFGQMQQPYLNGNATGSPFGDQMAIGPQPTGFGQFQQQRPQTGINSVLPPALSPQKTGYQSPPPQMQVNGFNQFQPQQQQPGFAPQPTGFQPMQQMQTGFQPPMQQMQPQPTGFGQTNGFNAMQAPPVPPIPQHQTPAPLVPQKTGPAPEVRFGVSAKKLQPQPTGKRANLSAATPQNPFGF